MPALAIAVEPLPLDEVVNPLLVPLHPFNDLHVPLVLLQVLRHRRRGFLLLQILTNLLERLQTILQPIVLQAEPLVPTEDGSGFRLAGRSQEDQAYIGEKEKTENGGSRWVRGEDGRRKVCVNECQLTSAACERAGCAILMLETVPSISVSQFSQNRNCRKRTTSFMATKEYLGGILILFPRTMLFIISRNLSDWAQRALFFATIIYPC